MMENGHEICHDFSRIINRSKSYGGEFIEIWFTPVLAQAEKPVVWITHHESCFYANDKHGKAGEAKKLPIFEGNPEAEVLRLVIFSSPLQSSIEQHKIFFYRGVIFNWKAILSTAPHSVVQEVTELQRHAPTPTKDLWALH